MNREHFFPRTKQVLIAAAAALAGASSVAIAPVMAQQPTDATVPPTHREVDRFYLAIPIEEISLTRQVAYGDLDLTTKAGVATLEGRVADAAKRDCARLDALYPPTVYLPEPADQNCVKSAVDHTMAQIRAAIADASKYSLR